MTIGISICQAISLLLMTQITEEHTEKTKFEAVCHVFQEHAPGCPHYFSAWGYVKHDYRVLITEGISIHGWPNGGSLHAGGLFFEEKDKVIVWIDPEGNSGASEWWKKHSALGLHQRMEDW